MQKIDVGMTVGMSVIRSDVSMDDVRISGFPAPRGPEKNEKSLSRDGRKIFRNFQKEKCRS